MMRLLLFVSRCLLASTLLLWVWLLWEHADPDVLLLPAGIVYLGLSLHRIPRLPTALERWSAFRLTTRASFALLIIIVNFHLVRFAQSLGASLDGTPVRPTFFGLILRGLFQGGYWAAAIIVVFMAFLRLPGVEQRLNAWVRERGAAQ
jgi:hypothetical protein